MEDTPDDTELLRLSTRLDPMGRPVLVVAGELCLMSGPELEAEVLRLADVAGLPVRIDLSGITFIDAAGLTSVVRCVKRLRAGYDGLRIVAVSASVRRIAEVTGTSWLIGSPGGAVARG